MSVKLSTRQVGDVTVVDVAGRITLGEGSSALRDLMREMVSKGATGGWLGFTTDDIHKTFESLKAKGVEFTQEPVDRFYGIDCGLRDPFGNAIRITQFHASFKQGTQPKPTS